MTEAEARAWVEARFGAAAADRLDRMAMVVTEENSRQNLIAPSTIATIWSRHLADSAQLARWSDSDGLWIDVGTGGGFPGIVLALLLDRPFLMIEPRRKRAEFLGHLVGLFSLQPRVRVLQSRVEAVGEQAETISARAVSGLSALLVAARACATDRTLWVLPRGQSGSDELGSLPMSVRGRFHVEHSLTDPSAVILIGRGLA